MYYEVNGDEVFITDCDQNSSGTLAVPAQIEGLPVTTLSYGAFQSCRWTRIILPQSLKIIEGSAFFKCESLQTINLPNTLESLGSHAFAHCASLSAITIPEGLSRLEGNTFYGCTALTSIEIPANITTISWLSPFGGCSGLSSIDLAPGQTNFTMVDGVLFDASQTTLIAYPGARPGTSYSVPESVTTIGAGAFAGCSILQSLTVPGRVGEIQSYTFQDIHSLEHIVLEEGITTIGWAAFLDGSSLIDISLPEGLTEIDTYAFVGCSSLTNLYLPSTVSSIGDYYHFDGCDSLMSIDVAPGNPCFSSLDGVLCDVDQTRIIAYPAGRTGIYTMSQALTGIEEYAFYGCNLQGITLSTNLTYLGESSFSYCFSLLDIAIPAGITNIPDYVFRSCTSMTNVIFPEGLLSVGRAAFYESSSLQQIILPDSVTSIGTVAFRGCSSVTDLRLSSSLKHIELSAFVNCDSLKGVIIPENLSSIDNYVFESCDVLNNAVFLGDAPTLGTNVFRGAAANFTIYYLADKSGFSSPAWEGYPAKELLFSFESNGSGIALSGCDTNVTGELDIPLNLGYEFVTTIGSNAFLNCSLITQINVPSGVRYIDNRAFSGCDSLTAFSVNSGNSSFSSVNGVLFSKDQSLLIYYPQGKSGIVYSVPNGVTGVVSRAFSDCSALTHVDFPSSLVKLAELSINDCSNLSSVLFEGNAPETEDSSIFKGLDPRFVVYFEPGKSGFSAPLWNSYPASPWIFSHTVNGDAVAITYADHDVSGAVIVPSYIDGLPVTEIGDSAFDGCDLLTNILLNSNIAHIGDQAFNNCSSLHNLHLPAGVTHLGDGAFRGCTSLEWIGVEAGNPAFYSNSGVLYDVSGTELIAFPAHHSGTYEIPAGVVTIRSWAFADSTVLAEVVLPAGLATVGGGAFYGCTLLESIVFPDSLSSLGGFSFAGCNQLISACFSGDAPTSLGPAIFGGTDPSFSVYYLSGHAGFTSPTWLNYASLEIDESTYPSAFWLLAHGLDFDIAMDQDLNGDGVELLMAYALNLDPNSDLSGSLPYPVIESNTMHMSYYAGRTNVLYTVETSTNLVAWTTNGVTVSGPNLHDEMEAQVDMDEPCRFLRLTVQQ